MNEDDPSTEASRIEDRLRRVGRYSRFVTAGLGVIVAAFALVVTVLLPENTDSSQPRWMQSSSR